MRVRTRITTHEVVKGLNGAARPLPALHILGNLVTAGRAVLRGQPGIPGTMNGVFVATEEISKPVTQIRPIASHSGRRFKWRSGFDVNPVMWKVLQEKGIAFRGPEPAEWGLDPEPGALRSWTLDQLNDHWRWFAEKCLSDDPPRKPFISASKVAIARVTGAPRLHCTVTTGEIISKDAAAQYALDTFGVRLGDLKTPRQVGEFMLEVISDAGRESFRGLER
ncbi:hypothetical protein LWC34_52645 [Kibdelosporangium philippinense]|uniref:Uncharacterized protein n=1 Tax=Kibdelosporangium philippinense TaxID=211113 RepID=A0ABS8ZUM4_9PSEU|nr:hypothetical protein [Kibdelosporangium philippinense]MCE7011406.1 hypothetical protein [Kibdelosporangium philippinense]